MLPKWAGWTGLVLTALFGGLNVFQYIKSYIRQQAFGPVKAQLEQIRVMCTEALETNETFKSGEARQFVINLGHQVRGIERGLGFDVKDVGTKRR